MVKKMGEFCGFSRYFMADIICVWFHKCVVVLL